MPIYDVEMFYINVIHNTVSTTMVHRHIGKRVIFSGPTKGTLTNNTSNESLIFFLYLMI